MTMHGLAIALRPAPHSAALGSMYDTLCTESRQMACVDPVRTD